MRPDLPTDLRHELSDPRNVVRLLNLEGGAIRQGGRNVSIRCVWHEERTASCSIHVGRDGTIACRCHACGASGDVLSLFAAAFGRDLRRDFVEVCGLAAELSGRWDLADELRGKSEPRPAQTPKPRPVPAPEREYPPIDQVRALLTTPAWEDAQACDYLRGRAIDPERLECASVGITYNGVEVGAVAYALPSFELPIWARYKNQSWAETGHRVLVPMVDAEGALRSVRAVRVVDGESPKRLPPGGHRAAGLVMADPLALALLRRTWRPDDGLRVAVRIVEGEPDWLTVLTVPAGIATAIIGIVSGSWTSTFAERIPPHALVAVETHADAAGERYAEEIMHTLDAAGVRVISRIAP